MNVTELQEVAKIIESIGEDAVSGLWVYLGVNFASSLLGYILGGIATILTYKCVRMAITRGFEESCANRAMREIRDILNTGPGGYLTSGEAQKTVKKIREMAGKD
jgi:hypothetical protein